MPPTPKKSRDAEVTLEYKGDAAASFRAAADDIESEAGLHFTLATVTYDGNRGPLLRLVFKGERQQL